MIIRPIKKKDFTSFVRHIQSSLSDEQIEHIGFFPSENHIERHSFLDKDYEEDLLLGAFDKERCIGSVMGLCRSWKNGREKTGYIKWILTDPTMRSKGIGSSLYKKIEETFISRNYKTYAFGSCAPSYFLPGLPVNDNRSKQFFEKRGWQCSFERVSIFTYLNKEILNYDELSLSSKSNIDFSIFTASENDKESLIGFVDKEFGESWSKEVKMALEGANPDSGAIVLKDENSKIIGFAAFHGSNPQWFGPMGVKPSFQKEGFGRILFFRAVEEMIKRGVDKTILPWINGKENFYPRFLKNFKWLKYYKLNKETVVVK